jgi:uncharacterized protein DUF3105
MAPPSKRPPQGRKPAQGKRPTQAKRPPQARKPAQTSKPASGGASTSGGDESIKSEATTATKSPAPAETSRIAEERKAKREAARQERIALARQKQKAKRRKQMLIAGVVAVALLGAIVYGVQKSRGQAAASKQAAQAAGCGPVQEIENQGRNHIPLSETFTDYNSNPPTSGPHYAERVANWGSYNEETPQTTLVHNLEHGGVVIHYKGQTEDQVDNIDSFVETFQDGVISNPNEKIDKPIVIASWTRMQKCESFSADALAGYIRENCNKGPEKLTTCRR